MINRKTLRNIKLIALREFKARVEKKVFKLVTRIMLLIALLIPSAPVFMQYFTQCDAQSKVVVFNHSGALAGRDPQATLAYVGQLLNSSSQTTNSGSGDT